MCRNTRRERQYASVKANSRTNAEVSQKDAEFILALQANNPWFGYNQWPRFINGHQEDKRGSA